MVQMPKEYKYSGPVMEFDHCIQQSWTATTYAISEEKALSNLAFRYKRDNNRMPNSKITLPGKITPVQ
jgi:hypothetical protein